MDRGELLSFGLIAVSLTKFRYYVSPHRDILANNHPGDPWYRLPAVGIAKFLGREVDVVSTEGSFYHHTKSDVRHWSIGRYLKASSPMSTEQQR